MKPHSGRWLVFSGCLSFAIALLHVAIILGGPKAYRYFGAGNELADMAAAGMAWPAVLTSLIALVFALWGLYAFSGAGVIRRMPFLRLGLVVIALIFTLRGLLLLPQIYWTLSASRPVELRHMAFSLASLLVGLSYGVGTIANWRKLKK